MVTNTWYSLSKDKSKLICFMNLREEGFVPKKRGLSMFNLTSPMKENSASFMFRESERLRKKTPKGPFFYDLVPKAQKSINNTLDNSSSHDWLECSFFVNSLSEPKKR